MVTTRRGRMLAAAVGTGLFAALTVPTLADIKSEDFETVTGSPGATILDGSGFAEVNNFDDGITGENAFFGTIGNTQATATVAGSTTGGVGGGGGVVFDVSDVSFNVLDENLDGATGLGGGVFLVGDPNDPNAAVFNFTLDFDTGLTNDRAFGGTSGGATLNGSMSAGGSVSGGVSGSGGAYIDVNDVTPNAGTWFAGLEFVTGPFPGATPLANPGFEDGLNGWATFGNAFAETTSFTPPVVIPRSGNGVVKMFGQFNGFPNESGVFQGLPASPGQTFELNGFVRTNSDDAIGAGNLAQIKLEFFDAGFTMIQQDVVTVLDPNSTQDAWLPMPTLTATAPAGTVSMQAVVGHFQTLFDGGAVQYDDVSLRITSGSPVNLADFALSADVRGIANAAGESLGDVELRIEDPAGNRLRFISGASGSYASIGGTLDTATEADADGNPASGVFDTNSSEYSVVIAFANEVASWGTGGTIEADNVLVSSADPNGSGWFGGVYFDGQKITEGDFSTLELTADIKGDVIGGEYEMRLEGFQVIEAGVDEDFSTITGTGGGLFLDPNGGPGFLGSFDDGINGESAFGGIGANSSIFAPGGMSAQGVSDPNVGTVAEIRVENIIVGIGDDWFAGLAWGNQGLASTDLSQVTLTADIRGVTASGGALGEFELRLEDAQGDRLYFGGTASSSFVTVGGTLDTATEGAALSGAGDGTFDLDSSTYTIAISFINPAVSWGGGGVLQVDNLFLTPVTIENEIGRVTFTGTADGNFNTIGGLLSSGVSTYGDYDTDLNDTTGASIVVFDPNNPGGGGVIDPGVAFFNGPEAFGGTFGTGVLGLTTADGCTSCGVGGSGALRIAWDSAGGDGWFLGISFPGVPLDLSGDLSEITVTADIKGTGVSQGAYVLRVEDADLDILEFVVDSDGTFQSVGGTLDTAVPGSVPGSDGSFNFLQETYSVVLVAVEPIAASSATWGTTGGELVIDNLFATGVNFDQADCHTITVAYRNELETWGTSAQLSIDNISFAENAGTPCPGDTDGDNDVDLSDLANVLANFGFGPGATLGQGDVDGNGFVDLSDLALVLANFGSTCP